MRIKALLWALASIVTWSLVYSVVVAVTLVAAVNCAVCRCCVALLKCFGWVQTDRSATRIVIYGSKL
jgi:hypothetical protein